MTTWQKSSLIIDSYSFPATSSGFRGNLFSSFGAELHGPRSATFQAALAPERHGGRVLAFVLLLFLGLPGREVHYALGEHIRVARSFGLA